VEYTIRNRCLEVTVSEHGAELRSIRDRQGTEYLWQGDPRYWEDRAPTLFPYVGRLTDGKYRLDGKLYSMTIHGFAALSDFTAVSAGPSALCMELRWSEETLRIYPRRFVFRVRCALRGRTLSVVYEVKNEDDRILYFGLGGHPGFRVPVREGTAFEDYRIRFRRGARPVQVGFSDACFVNGEDAPFPLDGEDGIPLRHSLFDRDAIVLRNMGPFAALELAGGERVLTVRAPKLKYLGIWHRPHTDAPYVCLEPWSSLPSRQGEIAVLEEKKDLKSLAPGESGSYRWSVEIGGAGGKGGTAGIDGSSRKRV